MSLPKFPLITSLINVNEKTFLGKIVNNYVLDSKVHSLT